MPAILRFTPVVLLTLAFVQLPAADAKPAHKQALANHFGSFLVRQLNNCQTCHVPEPAEHAAPPAGADSLTEDRPHNLYGARLKAIRKEYDKAGKDSDIAARIDGIAEEDSDGDGVSNLLEMLAGHNPGDAKDKPSAVEVTEARKKLPTYVKFRSAYPWRPFERVARPILPKVNNVSWVRNPIDAFVAAEHQERGLKPRPEAPKDVLVRRVYLDLIGLPPTIDELQRTLNDKSDSWYEKVVDQLLNDPRYGERWGRHWMDVWRYSDWAGWNQQVRDSQPHIWHWRDWIVESLNADKGYDRMLLEMLAADELCPEDTNALRATGYIVRNFKLLSREKWMQDTVDHTAQAFLGVTLGCAKCHDHQFDMIHQKEYYQVRAIFEPHNVRTDRLPGVVDVKKDGLVRTFDANPEVKTLFYIRGDERTPDKDMPIVPGVPKLLGGRFPKVEPVSLPASSVAPDRRSFVVEETVTVSAAAIPQARQALDASRPLAVRAFAQSLTHDPLRFIVHVAAAQKTFDALALAEIDAELAETRHDALVKTLKAERLEESGQNNTPAWKDAATQALIAQRHAAVWEAKKKLIAARNTTKAQAKALMEAEQALTKAAADIKQPPTTAYAKRAVTTYPPTSTGRRLAFARWVANRDNPLAARVAVNHMWLRHFGQAIVPSVFDFGRNGRAPSHPALLDWLAVDFMDNGWSMKNLHRQMLTSNTYRMSSIPDPAMAELDKDNRYLWRMSPRRIEAEVVRDCIFHVAGKLDLTMGGPDIDCSEGLTRARRSIYFRHAAEKQMEFLKLFDAPSVTECYSRNESVLPQQALALANSELTVRHARILARALHATTGPDGDAFLTSAFAQVLSRTPTAEERRECAGFLKEQTERYAQLKAAATPADAEGRAPAGDATLRARENLVHVLMNHHDFVTIR